MIIADSAANGADVSSRYHLSRLRKLEAVSHGLGADSLNADGYFHKILEADGTQIIARRRHARKTDLLPFPRQRYRKNARAQELDFRRFNEAEEVGEVNDAGHVGVGDLDAASRVKDYSTHRYFR